jgi:hypothetical protein
MNMMMMVNSVKVKLKAAPKYVIGVTKRKAPLILNFGASWGWMVDVMLQSFYHRGTDMLLILQGRVRQ